MEARREERDGNSLRCITVVIAARVDALGIQRIVELVVELADARRLVDVEADAVAAIVRDSDGKMHTHTTHSPTTGGGVSDWGFTRRLLSRGGSWYARTVLGVPVRDLTGGFKCFRAEVLEGIEAGRARRRRLRRVRAGQEMKLGRR